METKGHYQDIANRIRIDMDSRSPRLRLSVIGYLVDAGVTPKKLGGMDEWLNLIKETITYIGEDLTSFAQDIEDLIPPEESDDDGADKDKDAYSILKDGTKGYL